MFDSPLEIGLLCNMSDRAASVKRSFANWSLFHTAPSVIHLAIKGLVFRETILATSAAPIIETYSILASRESLAV